MAHYTAIIKIVNEEGKEVFSERHGSPGKADALGWAIHDARAFVSNIELQDDKIDGEWVEPECDISRIEITVQRDSDEVEADIKHQLATAKSFKDFAN